MSEWQSYKLGNFADIQTGPFGSQLHASDYVEHGIPSIMPTNIGNRLDIKTDTIVCITEEDASRLEKYRVKENDIVYSRRGDVEKCAFISANEAGWLCGTGCLRVRFISDQISPKFCAYYLSTEAMKGWVSGNAVGTTMPNLNTSILQRLPLLLPPLPEQRAIAAVFSSLDDKIDLLHRQNKTLEAMAETLFRQWFVEEDHELLDLGDVVETTSGGTPSRKNVEYYSEGTYFWVKSKELTGSYLLNTEEKITYDAIKKSSAKLLPKHSVLIAMYGATVGEYAIIAEEMTCNQAICALKPNEKYPASFLFFFVKENKENLINMAVGSAQQNISQQLIKKLSIPASNERIVEFDRVSLPIMKKIKFNIKSIQTLEKMRDMLLPKLMSGEVRVKFEDAA